MPFQPPIGLFALRSFPPRRSPVRQAAWLAILSVLFAVPASADENWPSFQNGGRLAFPRNAEPKKVSVAWSVELPGYGQSSPVVWDGQVYVTSVRGDNKDVYQIAAYRFSDGAKLWQHDVPNASPQENSNYVSKAAPTPAADERGLIAFFEGGNLIALTHAGKVRWERNLVEEFGAIDARHGLGASIEQTENTAFVWVERKTDPYLLALDKSSGETLWKVPGLGATSWSSPRLVPVSDGHHLVLSGSGLLVGLDPATGERLWTFDGIAGNTTPTPVPLGTGRFVIGASGGRGDSGKGRAAESNGVIAMRQTDDGKWNAEYVWKAERATSSFGSPMSHSGNVYFVNRTGVLYCLDAESGKEHYAHRTADSIWATPIAWADRLWLFGKDGVITTIAPGDTFRSLGEINVFSENKPNGEPEGSAPSKGSTLYAAVLAGDALLIRSGKKLICLRP